MSELPKITEIQRFTLQPGDRLIVHVEPPVTDQDISRIKERIREGWALPAEVPILVVGPGVTVTAAGEPQP